MSAFAKSSFANRSLQRKRRGQLAAPILSGPSNANARLMRSCFLQMSTISPSQPPLQSFALPPDNFSRYSKFLVRTSNIVDGMGKNHLIHQNNSKELVPWVDTLGVNVRKTPQPFSILSWNILAQSLYESHYRSKRIQQVALSNNNPNPQLLHPPPHPWPKRLHTILQTLSHANADIICLQECELKSFTNDLAPSMSELGYDGIAQEDARTEKPAALKEASKHRDPRNHIGATFWKRDKFELVRGVDVSVRTRSLTTVLRLKKDDDYGEGSSRKNFIGEKKRNNGEIEDITTTMPTVAIVNCHLEGHPKRFLERTLQLQHALSDLSKMMAVQQQQERKKKSFDNDKSGSSKLNALILAGDFNCELQSSACSTYLRMGRLGRQAGLGGIHGEDALVIPQSLLETSEAAEILHPIIEWGRALPEETVGDVAAHPFRRNGMTSVYPTWLGREDARQHFTYCGETNKRPVPGLDQIWYSSMTIERVGLKRMFVDSGEWRCISDENVLSQLRDHERRKVLTTGLPSPDGKYPSDHLPIGAVFDWKVDVKTNENSHEKHGENRQDVRRLQIVDEEGNNVEEAIPQDEPTVLIEEQQSFETPNDELAFLMKNCPFDTLEQRSDVEFLLRPINPPMDLTTRTAPTPGQLEQLNAKREKKSELLKYSSLGVRPWLKKIWKVEKQVGKWKRRQLMTRKSEK
ncbi:hypothetical protein ACHAWT_002818 [Skeletonema menzelii]